MEGFLIDNDINYSYIDLINSVNNKNYYYPAYKNPNLFEFFSNLIKGLIADQPLILIDSDLNEKEIKGLGIEDINSSIELTSSNIQSIKDLIEQVKHSKSEVTIFTSGTTGQPKKVIHQLESLTRSTRIGDKYQNQVWAFAYNPTHMAGLQVFFQVLFNNNLMVNTFNYQRNKIFDLIKKNQITHISATPTFYRLLSPFEEAYPSVERLTFGGEKSDQNLYNVIQEIFPKAKINNVYASTEAGSLFASKGDCFEIPRDKYEKFKVYDNELLIHKSLLGYSDSFSFTGEFYHTGDLIEWVNKEKGLFRFKSRKNELINIGGYKVNPTEIEHELRLIKGVKQALVYGRPNSILGNILCADIQLDSSTTSINEITIKKDLKTNLQDFKIPRRIKFVEEIAITKTGKLKRI